jgi:hypothetical protein
MRLRQFPGFLRGGRKLFLLEQKIRVLRICRSYRVRHWPNRLDVE